MQPVVQPNAKQLFKAVQTGDVTKLRGLLAAGAPVDSRDPEKMTPLMQAAKSGQAEAFRVLVEAGADLQAVGLDQVDVLELAAEGGNVEIVRSLLDRGLPLEGHWQPRSQAARRQGHMTPLICAAIEAHDQIVRLLLSAGADPAARFDGQTALEMVEEELEHPTFTESDDQRQRYQKIVSLLSGKGDGEPAPDAPALEVAKFAENARQPAHQSLRKLLDGRCGKARPWKPVPDHGLAAAEVVAYTLRGCDSEADLHDLQDRARQANAHLVLSEPWEPGEQAKLTLFPTADRFAVVAATGTAGANHNVSTADVLAWLRNLDKVNPFTLCFCGHDLVGGDFLGPVRKAGQVAEAMAAVCPSVLDVGFESPQELALALKKARAFLLRWD
jgi:hypothetical protein